MRHYCGELYISLWHVTKEVERMCFFNQESSEEN